VNQLKPLHVDQWLATQHWSSSTKRAAITCVKRCFSWARKQGYMEKSPVADMEKPEAGKRDIVLSDSDYKNVLGLVSDERFRDVLEFTWHTGARPQEVYALEARHVQLKNQRIVFPKDESKGKKRPRVIYLNPKALKIVKRLIGTGHIFRNADGEPFTKDSVNCCFNRIQVRLGKLAMKQSNVEIPEADITSLIPKLKKTVVEKEDGERPKTKSELRMEAKRKLTNRLAKQHAPKYCLYNLRHSFCHRLLTAGVDALTVSVLMGHQSPTVVATTYSHLSQADGHLLAALKKA
jgi:integrase